MDWKFLILLIAYMGLVAMLTLSPYTGEILYEKHYNLVPFRSIHNYNLYLINHGMFSSFNSFKNSMTAIINLLGNLFLLFPAGLMLPLAFPGSITLKKTVKYAFFTSLTIEVLQFFFLRSRIADVDDVIFNTLSAFIGYAIYRIIFSRHYRYYSRRTRRKGYFPDAK